MKLYWFDLIHPRTPSSSKHFTSKVLNWICHSSKAISQLKLQILPFSSQSQTIYRFITLSTHLHSPSPSTLLCLFSIFEEDALWDCVFGLQRNVYIRAHSYCWRWVNKIKLLKCFVCASECHLMDVDCPHRRRRCMGRYNVTDEAF